ncbi:nucleotidyltransferase family protein [Labilibaculum euxinus]
MKNYKNNIIPDKSSIRDALIRLNDLGSDLTLFVISNTGKLIGSLTDGDIRRALINHIGINESLLLCTNRNCHYLREKDITIEKIKTLEKKNIFIVPIVNDNFSLIKIINIKETYSILPLDAIIMAGGRGERLRPFTDSVPKPLLKVGGIPIIERNINLLKKYGINHMTIALKYLGSQIQDYFQDGSSNQINITYVDEKQALGTIGALKLAQNFSHDDLLVMNSDLLTNIDFEQMYFLFKESNADLVVASTSYEVNVPYAVLESDNGTIKSFREKPTYTYNSNAGIYMMKKNVVDIIPEGEFYNATDLIDDMIKLGKKVVHFPILGYWLDIGKHEDFEKAQKDVKRIKF